MKLIITGATGSLGAAMVRHFNQLGHQVIATGISNTPPIELLRCAEYIQADIRKPFQLPEADVCIHTAALSDDKGNPHDLYLANVTGTENVLQAANQCQKFIHISSSSVYLPSSEPLIEGIAGKQNNSQLSAYGYSKFLAELKLKEVNKHQHCIILRPRALYGVGDKVIIPRLLKLEHNQKLMLPGPMQVKISMTNYQNLAEAIERCFTYDKEGISTFNVADNTNYVLIDVLRAITFVLYNQKLPEKKIPVMVLKLMAIFKLGGITSLLIRSFTNDMTLDISAIQHELGYVGKMSLNEVLPEITEWANSIGGPEILKTGDKQLAWRVK